MHLSKLILNPRCREVQRDLSSPYELHRTLAHAYTTDSGQDYRAQHQVLFRIEPLSHATALPAVLVQSATAPNWNELPEAYLMHKPETKLLVPTFSVGQTLAFRLLANPTKKEKRPDRRQGRRIALPDYAEEDEITPARGWLVRKGEQNGFHVLYATTEAFWLGMDRGRATKNAIPIYGVRYDGLLQVTDPALLTSALQSGIGPSKAFGFGMLSLAKPQ
ncbi:type I-E CRISPR-associated protein Cas6/Cse3/CasE [Fibrisoma limi]|uniref:type I-E CRISPR-associated protein Cas6/Cse3/CasE n=1 Tax=Fibrisoma limi TaxID=663275 RepID=UPI000586DE0D|nr:type I-E CRISPR-associated protein Cas6/Cse3/CasE [Fibrisoma limi]